MNIRGNDHALFYKANENGLLEWDAAWLNRQRPAHSAALGGYDIGKI
jgi:hypothetical protein